MIWTTFITVLTLLGVTYGLPSPESKATFVEARWITGTQQQTLSLPARLPPAKESEYSKFHFEWENTNKLIEPALYAPSLFHLHELRINGVVQVDSLRYDHLLSDTSRPLLVRLPTNDTSTIIDITLTGSAVIGGYLSELWIGERSTLESYYKKQHMTTIGFRKFLSYWLFLLAIVMALLWALRRQDLTYGLFAVIALCQVIDNLTIIVDNSLLPTDWFRVGYLSDFWKAVILVPFAYSFTKTHSPLPTWFFFALCVIASIISVLVPTPLFLSIEKYLLIPISCLHLLWGIVLISRAVRRGHLQSALVLITLLMATAFAVHDILIIFGYIENHSNFLLVYSFLPVLSTICIILVYQFVQSQKQIDNMVDTLKERLESRENMLQKAFKHEQKIQHQRTITEERQRIIADMHDGLGGQLMSIIANANSTSTDKQAISLHARQALTDLRLMILSLDNDNQDLVGLLAAFRERAQSQCESFGVEFQWQANALPQIDSLSPVTSANLLRIMQEALQNALRHSDATQITLSATSEQDGSLQLCVQDNGKGGVDDANEGRGMRTLRRRATAIEALLVITSGDSGTEVRLNVPSSSLKGSS